MVLLVLKVPSVAVAGCGIISLLNIGRLDPPKGVLALFLKITLSGRGVYGNLSSSYSFCFSTSILRSLTFLSAIITFLSYGRLPRGAKKLLMTT